MKRGGHPAEELIRRHQCLADGFSVEIQLHQPVLPGDGEVNPLIVFPVVGRHTQRTPLPLNPIAREDEKILLLEAIQIELTRGFVGNHEEVPEPMVGSRPAVRFDPHRNGAFFDPEVVGCLKLQIVILVADVANKDGLSALPFYILRTSRRIDGPTFALRRVGVSVPVQ